MPTKLAKTFDTLPKSINKKVKVTEKLHNTTQNWENKHFLREKVKYCIDCTQATQIVHNRRLRDGSFLHLWPFILSHYCWV